MGTEKEKVVVDYVAWKLKHGEHIEQKFLDYLDTRNLLQTAIKLSKV